MVRKLFALSDNMFTVVLCIYRRIQTEGHPLFQKSWTLSSADLNSTEQKKKKGILK